MASRWSIKYLIKCFKYLAYVSSRFDHSGLEGTMKNMQQTRTNVQWFLKLIGNLVVIYLVKYIPVYAGSIYAWMKGFSHIQIFDCIHISSFRLTTFSLWRNCNRLTDNIFFTIPIVNVHIYLTFLLILVQTFIGRETKPWWWSYFCLLSCFLLDRDHTPSYI